MRPYRTVCLITNFKILLFILDINTISLGSCYSNSPLEESWKQGLASAPSEIPCLEWWCFYSTSSYRTRFSRTSINQNYIRTYILRLYLTAGAMRNWWLSQSLWMQDPELAQLVITHFIMLACFKTYCLVLLLSTI